MMTAGEDAARRALAQFSTQIRCLTELYAGGECFGWLSTPSLSDRFQWLYGSGLIEMDDRIKLV